MFSPTTEDIANYIHSKCRVSEEELLERFKGLTREELQKELFVLEHVLEKSEVYYIHGMYVSKHCRHLEC